MKPLLTPTLSSPAGHSAAHALRVISQQSLKLAPGERLTMQVHRAGNGVFTLSGGGQTITVEGLPNTIGDGTRITVFTSSRGNNILNWSLTADGEKPAGGSAISPPPATSKQTPIAILAEAMAPHAGKAKGHTVSAKSDTSSTHGKITGKQPISLQSLPNGTPLSGKVVAHEGERMTLQLAVASSQSAGGNSVRQYGGAIPSAAPLLLTTAEIPGKQPGSPISASLQRDQQGAPILLVATDSKPAPSRVASTPITQRMRPGDQAIGVVRQKLDNGALRIDLRGAAITAPPPPAKLAPTIKVGDGLLMQMRTAADPHTPPTLEIRRHLPALLANLQQQIRRHLPDSAPIATTIARIQQQAPAAADQPPQRQLEAWLQRARHNSSSPITGSRLAALIRDAGHLLEHKLLQQATQPISTTPSPLEHDLKTVLTRLAASAPQPQPPTPSSSAQPTTPSAPPQHQADSPPPPQPPSPHSAADAAQQGVQRIESSQMHATLSALHHEPMRIELPMVVFNQLVTVQMAIAEQQSPPHSRNHDDKQQSFSVLIALELSHLGEVRIDSTISRNAVWATMHLATEQAADFARGHLHRLTAKLEAAGFTHASIAVANQPPNPEKARQFAALTTMVPHTSSLLDIAI